MGNLAKNKRGEHENSRDNSCKEGKNQMVWNGETQKSEGAREKGAASIKDVSSPSVVWQMTAQLRPAATAADSPQLKQRQRQRGREADKKWDRPSENKNNEGQKQVDKEAKGEIRK